MPSSNYWRYFLLMIIIDQMPLGRFTKHRRNRCGLQVNWYFRAPFSVFLVICTRRWCSQFYCLYQICGTVHCYSLNLLIGNTIKYYVVLWAIQRDVVIVVDGCTQWLGRPYKRKWCFLLMIIIYHQQNTVGGYVAKRTIFYIYF